MPPLHSLISPLFSSFPEKGRPKSRGPDSASSPAALLPQGVNDRDLELFGQAQKSAKIFLERQEERARGTANAAIGKMGALV